jgi:hypothetical protein
MKLATETNASDSRANRTMILNPSVDVRGSFYSGFVLTVKSLFIPSGLAAPLLTQGGAAAACGSIWYRISLINVPLFDPPRVASP